jgi:hypothetical protein
MEQNYQPDIRDISIIDALPIYDFDRTILTCGCGKGRLEHILSNMDFHVIATDLIPSDSWKNNDNLIFMVLDILNPPKNFNRSGAVICSQVLEHIEDYKTACFNLIGLCWNRLIITIPFKHSFNDPGHKNFWSNSMDDTYKDITEFYEIFYPFSTSITKILTKPQDKDLNQSCYLIIVDKKQSYA